MQDNITASMPGSTSPKPIQQSDIEQDYDFLLAQKVSQFTITENSNFILGKNNIRRTR